MLDTLIIMSLFFGLWQGFRNGLLRSLVGMFGWLIALVCASFFAKPLSPLFEPMFDAPVLAILASFIAVALLIIIALQLVLWLMNKTLKGLKLTFVDKIAGAIFAVAKNLMIILLILSMIVPFIQQTPFWQHSIFAQSLMPFAPFAVQMSKKIANEMQQTTQQSMQELDKMADLIPQDKLKQ